MLSASERARAHLQARLRVSGSTIKPNPRPSPYFPFPPGFRCCMWTSACCLWLVVPDLCLHTSLSPGGLSGPTLPAKLYQPQPVPAGSSPPNLLLVCLLSPFLLSCWASWWVQTWLLRHRNALLFLRQTASPTPPHAHPTPTPTLCWSQHP